MELTDMKPQELMQHYRSDIELLVRYLPWLESKRGQEVSNDYHSANEVATSFSFPVYDGTLLNFVKDVQKTSLTDRNYQYVYSRNHIETIADEYVQIDRASVQEMNILIGILSKYILGGRTKGGLWPEGVRNGVYLAIVNKLKELCEFWDKPIR